MLRWAPLVLGLLAAVAACGGGGETAGTGATEPGPPEREPVRCESPAGFSLERPSSWSTNAGDVVPACSQLHPEPFEVPEGTDERVAAITAYVEDVPFHELAAPDPARDAERAATTIDGLQAVRLEYETGDGLWPEGTPVALYAIDLSPGPDDGPGTLVLDTVGLETFDYERNRAVLDRVARSVEVTLDGVATEPGIVARYEGGGGGFAVEGEVNGDGDEACLRIPPGGEPVCTALPADDQVHTIQLVDLEPILAGVTGRDVFRVVAERRDGEPSTFLPAPLAGTDAGAFAFTFPLAELVRLTLHDRDGTELRVVEPGG